MLSQEEQRRFRDIERRLLAEDPDFAGRVRQLSAGSTGRRTAWPFLLLWLLPLVFGAAGGLLPALVAAGMVLAIWACAGLLPGPHRRR